MIYSTNSLSKLDEHPTHIAYSTKTIHERPEIVQVLDSALDLRIQGSQVTFVSLHINFSRQSTC